MLTCPVCQFENAAFADGCTRCGRRFAAPAAVTVRDKPQSFGADTADPGSGAGTPMPLPAPMTEPIAPTLPVPVPAPKPGSVLVKGLPPSGSGSISPSATARQPVAPATDPAAPALAPEPQLVVVRGERLHVAYPVLDGKNYIGRSADLPVDIDLDGQEPVERIWTSRKHAVVTWDRGSLVLEDLNSLNGTFVNRSRIHPGQPRQLQPGDVVQIGTVQLKVVV